MKTAAEPEIKTIACPFTIVVDSREQLPYSFPHIWDGPTARAKLMLVPTVRAALTTGDYSIQGMEEQIAIERKSKADLYGSISQARANFVGRLERMSQLDFAAVVVEAEWAELLGDPPLHTKYSPKSLSRTINAWMVRYPVHWVMMPSRSHAEAKTFRLLERYWKDQQEQQREKFDPRLVNVSMNDPESEGEKS